MWVMLKKARELALAYGKKNEHSNAVFWAEKATILSGGDINDVYLYAEALYSNHEFRRAITFLEANPQLGSCSGLRYLAAKCMAACKSWEEVVSMLKTNEYDENDGDRENTTHSLPDEEDVVIDTLGKVTAPSLVLLGRAYEALGNMLEAIDCYKEALVEDVYCLEALDSLYNIHALTANDEQTLLASLPFKQQCSVEEERSLRYLYQSKLRYHKDSPLKAPDSCAPLATSIDLMSNVAETLFRQMSIKECLNQTREIMSHDPYHFPTILVHIPCCIVSNATKDLYTLSHSLVKHYPTLPISWYAVSAYYYTTGKHTQARRYLTKSINLGPHFAHSHLLFGLSFTSEGQHDQAVAAFSSAARYLRGSHVPLMYLGKEYFLTSALPIATSFFKNALSLAPNDPTLLQEVAVVLLSSGRYEKAENYLRCAASLLSNVDPHVTLPVWEPVFNNLGHAQRKLGKYQEAIESHMKALQLSPNEPSTFSSIAFVYLLMEEYGKVVEYCNRSLRVRREDLVTIELLQMAMKELAVQSFELDEGPLDQTVYSTAVEETAANVSVSSSESAMQTD